MSEIFPQPSSPKVTKDSPKESGETFGESWRTKPVAVWLLIGVGMIIIQILLGGVTRLTGSGLSITEWDVITGTLPPMNEQQWTEEFNKYKQTPQFQLLNYDFTLEDFRFIFFLGMVSSFLGKTDRGCICDPLYHFSFSKKI